MKTFLQYQDGEWLACEGVPLSDRGFRHGISVFETILVKEGRFEFLTEHLQKLRHATTVLGLMDLPDSLEASLAKVTLNKSPAVARITITAGDGGLDTPYKPGRLFLWLEEMRIVEPKPLSLRIHPTVYAPVWPGLKTGNYAFNLQARRDAKAAGFDDAVLVNAGKHVVSTATANIFAVLDGMLVTPRTASGARAGVMRDWVLANTEVVVCDFHPEQLKEATEIFLTNSLLGVASVSRFENGGELCREISILLNRKA